MGQTHSAHSTDPSRFWELSHVGSTSDLLPSPHPSYRSPIPSSRGQKPGSHTHTNSHTHTHNSSSYCSSSVSCVGSPYNKDYSRERSESVRGVSTPRFDTSSPVRAPSPARSSPSYNPSPSTSVSAASSLSASSLLSMMAGDRGDRGSGRERGRARVDTNQNPFNTHNNNRSEYNTADSSTHGSTQRRSSSAPPRSSSSTSRSYDVTHVGGLTVQQPQSQLQSCHPLGGSISSHKASYDNHPSSSSPSVYPLRLSVDCKPTSTSAATSAPASAAISTSASTSVCYAGDGYSTPGTPGHSRPPTPVSVGAYLSPERKDCSRSFSLRKSFPERLGFSSSSVLTGGRDVYTVSSSAPYAVNLPDQ